MELAGGAGDSAAVRQLRDAQLSKHLMLLHVVAGAAAGMEPSSTAIAAFRTGYELLAEAQAADPGVVARLLGLPQIGSWAHECLACLDNGSLPDFAYLAAAAAAAAVQAGLRFELDAQVRNGRVPLPGLGCLQVPGHDDWIRLSGDGECLRAGEDIEVPYAALVPDDGSGGAVPHWRGTPRVRAVADGRTWEVLLETSDRYLDRYALPVAATMPAAEVTKWRQRIQGAWELLVRHHDWAAGPLAAGVDVVVPLVPRSDLDSATSPAAFGAIATSLPPSPVSMAETLVHEFQHIKLCGLTDMLPLIEPSDERRYAPWREDPRPLGGILQGVYAFAGIVRFWQVQRSLETEPDDVLRANVLYERWRLVIEPVTRTLVESGLLTAAGARFVAVLTERGLDQGSGPVPAEAQEIARAVALDNWLTWQLRHMALDTAEVAGLAAAYQRGEPLGDRALPEARVEDDTRKIGAVPRSRLLHMRYQDPRRYRQLSPADTPELSGADALLVSGNARAALAAYREELTTEPGPAAWIGLALAADQLPETSSRPVFTVRLPLLVDMHAYLADQEIKADPLDLAAWLE